MPNKKIMILAMALAGLLLIGAASAADVAGDDNSTDVIGQDSDSAIGSTDDLEVGQKDVISTPKTFKDLDDLINREYKDNDTIQLSENYTFNSTTDSGYEVGILIKRTVTIYGNGITLDGANSARVFYVTGANVEFHNITFVNCYANIDYGSHGGAIFSDGVLSDAFNCTFIKNCADGAGGALLFVDATDCIFISNIAASGLPNSGGGGAMYGGTAKDCIFINNRVIRSAVGGAMSYGNAINCTFINNCVQEGDVCGGAMYGGSATNPTFILNYANGEGWDYYSTSISGTETSIGSATIVVSDFVSTYNSGEKLPFDVVHDNEILKGVYIDITIKNETFNKAFSVLSGEAVPIDLAPGVYEATLSNGHPNVQSVTIKIKITNGDTFSDLNKTIYNSTSTKITLDRDYAYNSTVDAEFGNGIILRDNINIDGQGHLIDARSMARIFDVEGGNVTLSNITFKNANNVFGGAIIVNSNGFTVSKSTFTNNTAEFGGAIFSGAWDSRFEDCIFISNNATQGGALFFDEVVNNTVMDCNFEQNTAINGSAIYWKHSDGFIYRSTFINNTAMYGGAAIYLNGNITNIASCLFINNAADYGIVYYECFYKGFTFNSNIMLDGAERGEIFFSDEDKSANIDFNWFGNNATNCQVGPACNQVPDVWLFLDASADPLTLPAFGSSDITFNLYIYKSLDPFIRPVYDASLLMPVNLTVSSTNGHANATAVPLGKSVRYTAEGTGKGSLTAALEYANFTVELAIMQNPDLSVESQTITYGSNATLALSYNSSATGRLNITLNGKKFNYTFKDIALNATVSLGKLNPDEYNVTVTYSGDETFSNSTAKAALTVDPIVDLAANITADKEAYLIGDLAIWTVTVTSAGNGSNATDVILDMWFPFQYFEYVTHDVDRGSFDAESMQWDIDFMKNGTNATLHITGLAKVSKKQITNRVVVACNESDWNILNNFAYSYVDVEKLNSTVDLNSTVTEYGNALNITVKTEGATGISAKINGTNASVDGFTIQIPIMDAGVYNLTVTTIPDVKYNPANKTVTITVNKVDSTLDVNGTILYYGETTKVNATFDGAYGITAKLNGEEIIFSGTSIPIPLLNAGVYNLTVTTIPDGNHIAVNKTVTITVLKQNATVDIEMPANITAYENSTASVKLPSDAKGNVTLSVDGIESSTVPVEDGSADITIPSLSAGNHTVEISYSGDGNYNPTEKIENITVYKQNANANITMPSDITVGDTPTVDVKLPGDATGNVSVKVDGETVDTVAVSNGTASITMPSLTVGNHTVEITYTGDEKYAPIKNTASLTVNKKTTAITASVVTTTYNINKDLVITLRDGQNNSLSGVNLTVKIDIAKNYTTDKDGQVIIATGSLIPNKYVAEITFNGDDKYAASNATANVVVKKATPSLTAKSKSFQDTDKAKKYAVVLKDNTGKPIKKVKVYLKVNGRVYSAVTDNNGKAIFKLTKLTKKGSYKALIVYKGDNKYNKVGKKVKIDVKTTFKTVGPGSKDKTTVKKIQKALKNKGYYLTYRGHYLMIDGYYGSCTQRSVKEFQSANGLKVTGSVDYKTAKKLGII